MMAASAASGFYIEHPEHGAVYQAGKYEIISVDSDLVGVYLQGEILFHARKNSPMFDQLAWWIPRMQKPTIRPQAAWTVEQALIELAIIHNASTVRKEVEGEICSFYVFRSEGKELYSLVEIQLKSSKQHPECMYILESVVMGIGVCDKPTQCYTLKEPGQKPTELSGVYNIIISNEIDNPLHGILVKLEPDIAEMWMKNVTNEVFD